MTQSFRKNPSLKNSYNKHFYPYIWFLLIKNYSADIEDFEFQFRALKTAEIIIEKEKQKYKNVFISFRVVFYKNSSHFIIIKTHLSVFNNSETLKNDFFWNKHQINQIRWKKEGYFFIFICVFCIVRADSWK